MPKAKTGKTTPAKAPKKSSLVMELPKEEVIEEKIKKIGGEAVYFVVVFVVLGLFIGLFGTAGVLAAIRYSVPYYKTASSITGSGNLFNNGTQVGIGSSLWGFGNRNPLNLNKSQNGVLTIDGDIKLSKVDRPPTIKEDRLYNWEGDLFWNSVKVGIWSSEPVATDTLVTYNNVGIGTNNPKLKLHVKVGDAGGYPTFTTSADMLLLEGGNYSIMQFLTNGATTGGSGSYIEFSTATKRSAAYIGYVNGADAIVFGHGAGAVQNMEISSNGNVGIGVSSPSEKLVIGSGNVRIMGSGGSSNPTTGRLIFDNTYDTDGAENSTANKIALYNDNSPGVYGIGISNGAFNIFTSGDINFFRGVGNKVAYIASDGSYNKVSDANFKENICTINNSLDKINKLNGVSFNFKDNKDKSNLGFIAQEVEKVLPELVSTNSQGLKMLDYDGIIPVLVNAMQEQQRQIEELRTEIEKLKAGR